jgi:phospholipid/cholesterol/gamma-HCH transport system substrate-binding protein
MSPAHAVRRDRKAPRRLAGVAFLVVLVLLGWLSIALYQKKFSSVALVTVNVASVGNEMHPGAQVMVRGVQVGQVRSVSADGTGARLVLALQPADLSRLPANVSAEMLPTTLFGERYVDLVLPRHPVTATLTSGSVIEQNRSSDALELEQVLNNLLPMLTAIQPDKLSVTLTAIAQGLQGRGAELGQTLVTLNSYLKAMNPRLPQFDTDLTELANLSRKYSTDLPSVLAALNDFSVTGRTLARQGADYAALLTNITIASDDLHNFLNGSSGNIIDLTDDSLPTLEIFARYSAEFPCTLTQLANFVPAMNKALGAGTDEPGLHVRVLIVPSLGAYQANRDAPVYDDDLGPSCYAVPFKGITLHDEAGQSSGAGKSGRGSRP